MLRQTITYNNPFTDEEVSEEYYFHMSSADLIEMDISYPGGWGEHLKKITEEDDRAALYEAIKNLILMSYGQRSEDGKRHIKNQEIRDEFVSSEAYSALLMELISDADLAARFMNAVMPKNLEAELEKIKAGHPELAEEIAANNGTPVEAKLLTQEEASAMDSNELQSGLAAGRYKLS